MAKAQRIKTARVSPKPMPGDRHALKLGVEGDGVSPSSFDVLRTLTFVHAFVSVSDALADGKPLGLTGLGIAPGSTAFCFDAPEADRARVRSMATETQRFIRHEHDAPKGVRSKLADVSIDWTVKESARAKLRVIVKRILRKHGYPPDKQEAATDTVLAQAEELSDTWMATA